MTGQEVDWALVKSILICSAPFIMACIIYVFTEMKNDLKTPIQGISDALFGTLLSVKMKKINYFQFFHSKKLIPSTLK